MWYWIIKVSILSLVFIFLLHYLYSFFVSTLTVPKVKDLVTLPQEKYDKMFHSLQQPLQPLQCMNDNNDNNATVTTQQSMKEDLIHFLKDIGSSSSSGSEGLYNSKLTAFDSLDSNISSFSFTK